MRKAFTLIELMISIAILSIMMLFLYRSYAMLNRSNQLLSQEGKVIAKKELLKKVIYLDFTLAMSVSVLNQSKTEDVVVLQTGHSLHQRFHPFVAYIIKDAKLYRIESLRPIKSYPLSVESEFVTDFLGEVEIFRTYKSIESTKNLYLVHIKFSKDDAIVLKVRGLNIMIPLPLKISKKQKSK